MTRSYPILLAVAVFIFGCGHNSQSIPTLPDDQPGTPLVRQSTDQLLSNRVLFGYYDVTIDLVDEKVILTPNRQIALHFNALKMLEESPCSDCLVFDNVSVDDGNVVGARVKIKHPMAPTKKLVVFDVRGIFITAGNFEFGNGGRKIAFHETLPLMLGTDGYTVLFNPLDFPYGGVANPLFAYYPGRFSSPASGDGSQVATLNPYTSFGTELPRRMFGASDEPWIQAGVSIQAPVTANELKFGYAINASWMKLDEVDDPLTDFPPEANCLEAYQVTYVTDEDLPPYPGGETGIDVYVYDHQGIETIDTVTMEAPDIFWGQAPLTFQNEEQDGAAHYTGTLVNEYGVIDAVLPFLITVKDIETDPNFGILPAYDISFIDVNIGWAQTWGGAGVDAANSVKVDDYNNVYVTGQFSGNVDFDPGDGVEAHYAEQGAFFSKFDPLGEFLWVIIWGEGTGGDAVAHDISIAPSGEIYVTGSFNNTVDFGSGPIEGIRDAFLVKYSKDGEFRWVKTWGADEYDGGFGVDTPEEGGVYVSGTYAGTVDFDPGSGYETYVSNGKQDIFVSRFYSNGEQVWTRTFGGAGVDFSECLSVSDDGGSVFVTGAFAEHMDFNPTTGIDIRLSNGGLDCFVTKFSTSGNYFWTRTWGGPKHDACHTVGATAQGMVVTAGEFRDAADFDTGPGDLTIDPPGELASFVSMHSWNGEFMTAKAWGAVEDPPPDQGDGEEPGKEPVNALAFDQDGNLYVTGYFAGCVDFDPDAGEALEWSNGGWDAFVTKFDSTGSHLWTIARGGPGDDRGMGIAVSRNRGVYMAGFFHDSVDFDPSSGTDNHSSLGESDAFLVKYSPDGDW